MRAAVSAAGICGTIDAIPSKSFLHRALICASLADAPTDIYCHSACEDVDATADCLRALGASIEWKEGVFSVTPIRRQKQAFLQCRESGSTLRFLLPLAAALGTETVFEAQGRLSDRPLSPLYEEMARHSVTLSENGVFPLRISGKLQAGEYVLSGGVSSQFFTGLLLALQLADSPSVLRIEGKLESAPYVYLTLRMLDRFGIRVEYENGEMRIVPSAFRSPGRIVAEGDWSNSAFWLAGGVLSGNVSVRGLRRDSTQGDRAVEELLRRMGGALEWQGDLLTASRSELHGIDVDASQIPDLVPILAVTAAFASGTTRITGAARLKLKESDRIRSVCELIRAIGGTCVPNDDGMTITGNPELRGGNADAFGDHRIAMSAAIASCRCREPVVLSGAESTRKSYPGFWEDFENAGGKVCFLSEK